MNKNLAWRFVIIIGLILLCCWEVWPPAKKLKQGIDLAGGTSLLYQIDTTGLTDIEKRTVAQDMIRILQQRIDPGNKRNLIWRPQGNDRIEIQMPLATEGTRQLRLEYQQKRQPLEDYNLDLRRVRQALTKPAGMTSEDYLAARKADFAALAGDSPERMELLVNLGQAYDELIAGEARLEKALGDQEKLRSVLLAADVNAEELGQLYRDWEKLDDPNRAIRIAELAGEKTSNKDLISNYLSVRRELGEIRKAMTDAQSGLRVKELMAWRELENANFDMERFQKILEVSRGRSSEISKLKEQHPSLAAVLDEVLEVYDAYSKVAGRLDDPEDLKRMLRGSGVLEFRILPRSAEGVLSESEEKRYHDLLQQYGPNPQKSGDEKYAWRKIKSPEDFQAENVIRAEYALQEYVLASNLPDEMLLHEVGEDVWRLQNAQVGNDNMGKWAIFFGFNELGAGRFFELTKNNLKRPLCILLDGEVISAPTIQSAIGHRGQITGNFSGQEVQDMVDKLNAGSLPARLGDQPISENTVGPTMGRDNLVAALRAGIYGLIAVAIFMLVYYLIAGSLADIALFLNLLLIMGVMAVSRATFTMPGLAGLILTIGMAVDANVLIFERIREEQGRGSSLRMAIKNGYDRAFRTILDANITTFIVALILWMLASEEVKGFALTLMIGIVSSMFTALFVTRTVFDVLTGQRILKNKLVMLQIVRRPKIDWMKARPIFWLVSIVLVFCGWWVFLSRDEANNSKYSIEFTGGTSIHVVLNDAGANMDRAAVEKAISQVGITIGNPLIEGVRVQRIGPAEKREFEIVTTETNRLQVPLTLAAGSKLTADSLNDAIKEAAKKLGDARMLNSELKASNNPGALLLETNQVNRNKVRRVLSNIQRDFSPLDFDEKNMAETGNVLKVTLKVKPGKQLSVDVVNTALHKVANAAGDMRMAQAIVKAASEAGEFVLELEQVGKARAGEILNRTVEALSEVQYGDMVTKDVVSDAVLESLKGKLDVQDNLEPGNIASEPITRKLIAQNPYLADYLGGVLVKADFASGKSETMSRLADRFEQIRFKNEFEKYGTNAFKLFAPGNTDAEVLASLEMAVISPDLVYGDEQLEEWNIFVKNETERFSETLKWKTSLPRVTQIDPSVGKKSKNDALEAIVFSLLAIILYIWIRFGTVRFGVAAVVALVHDVSIAMGLVAASAWLSTTKIGQFLMISDFKIDLPMIAGFLTVIGYSLNDTIVVFDRIRENRGKLATLSAGIISNSINQTISRTILTSVTTLLVLVTMYIWGGPGLRGFNYVLIIGVLVGTYSSIGIAAPLLYGARAHANKPAKKADNKA